MLAFERLFLMMGLAMLAGSLLLFFFRDGEDGGWGSGALTGVIPSGARNDKSLRDRIESSCCAE